MGWIDHAATAFTRGTAEDDRLDYLTTLLGAIAAAMTSLSYIPQVRKVLDGQPTDDLSLKMLAILTAGLALWVAYGLMKPDWIVVTANVVGASLTGFVLYHKLREQ